MGFISRQEAEDFLHKSENGTFLIRFSDSELGGVTVAWITVNEAGHREVAMLQPFTRKDLMIRSLPDRLKDCPQVSFLHVLPKIPKLFHFENSRWCCFFPTKAKTRCLALFIVNRMRTCPLEIHAMVTYPTTWST